MTLQDGLQHHEQAERDQFLRLELRHPMPKNLSTLALCLKEEINHLR